MYYTNELDDGYLLLTGFLMDERRTAIRLVRLKDGATVKSWYPDPDEIRMIAHADKPRFRNRFEAQAPLITADGGLIFNDSSPGPLVKLDRCSNIEWVSKRIYHHSLERDLDGNLLTLALGGKPRHVGMPDPLRNDTIAVVSPTGDLLFEKPIYEILLENGYHYLFYTLYPSIKDALHANDVEVASFATEHWEVGDLLVSIREVHTVFIYRPATGKIVWLRSGPWIRQHDPDFLPNGTIAVFGNNIIDRHRKSPLSVFGHSNVYIYNFATDTVATPYTAVMEAEAIRTPTQGRSQILENGDVFVEESDLGRLVRLSPLGLKWTYYNSDGERAGALAWSRYLPKGALEGIDLSGSC